MSDRERSQEFNEEEEAQLSSPDSASSVQDLESGGGDSTSGESDPPIISSGG